MGATSDTRDTYCIVTDENEVIEAGLSLYEAEHKLARYLNNGEDCYLAHQSDYCSKTGG